MSGITYIKRFTGAFVNLVQINTTDSTSIASAVGYLTAQAANIAAINEGPFQWAPGDVVLLEASDGSSWFLAGGFVNGVPSVLLPLSQNPSGYYQQSVTLAQFLANYATPVLVIPAQGANTMIILDHMEIVQTYGSAALAAGGAVTPQYGNTADGGGVAAGTEVAAADFQQTSSTVYPIIGVSGDGKYLPESSCGNKGIYLSNPTAAFTGGTGSTFIVKSYFHVISLIS